MDRCMKHIPTNRHTSLNSSGSQEAPEIDTSYLIWVDQEHQNNNIEESNPDPLNSQTDTEYDSSKPDDSLLCIKKEKEHSSPIYKKVKKKKVKHRSKKSIVDELVHDEHTDELLNQSWITDDVENVNNERNMELSETENNNYRLIAKYKWRGLKTEIRQCPYKGRRGGSVECSGRSMLRAEVSGFARPR
ncbi:unnamed protein product, partial [Iphiclides podalirius]